MKKEQMIKGGVPLKEIILRPGFQIGKVNADQSVHKVE